MTIRHLKYFIAVAETGKMSTAAAQCYVSQPTVSQTIKELEEHYRVLLFERISKKLYITEAGKNLLIYAKMVVKQFDELEDNMFTGYSEKIRIGATVTVGSCILSALLNQFKEIMPKVDTFAYVNNTKSIEEKMLKSELDIGIVEGQIINHELVTIPAIKDSLVVVCSRNHRLAGRKQISVKELENERFVMREEGSGTRKLFEHYMSSCGSKFKICWEATCPSAIKQAVMENNCLTAISARLVEEEIKNGQIYVIKSKENALDRFFNIVYYKNKYFNESMKTFMNIVEQYKNKDIFNGIESGILVKDL